MTNCLRTDDYECYCTNIMAWNYRCSSERLTTFTTFKNAHDFHDFRLLRFLEISKEDTIKKVVIFDRFLLKNRDIWGFRPIL